MVLKGLPVSLFLFIIYLFWHYKRLPSFGIFNLYMIAINGAKWKMVHDAPRWWWLPKIWRFQITKWTPVVVVEREVTDKNFCYRTCNVQKQLTHDLQQESLELQQQAIITSPQFEEKLKKADNDKGKPHKNKPNPNIVM